MTNTSTLYDYPDGTFSRVESKSRLELELEILAGGPHTDSRLGRTYSLAANRKHPLHYVAKRYLALSGCKEDESYAYEAMPENLQAELDKLTQQQQRQDGALAQLKDLHAFANKLGLYDAADLIKTMTAKV